MAKEKKEFFYEIINELGEISKGSKGWRKEFNRVSWNGAEPKYDIREWDEKHERMGKGVTLTKNELLKVKEVIDKEIELLNE